MSWYLLNVLFDSNQKQVWQMKELNEQEIQFVSGAGAAEDGQKIAGMIGGVIDGITGIFGFKFGFKDILGSIGGLIGSIVDTAHNNNN